jgi:hypothetical protein
MNAIDESIFLTPEKFFKTVDDYVWKHDSGYIESTIKACEYYMIDYEDIYKMNLINPILKDKLRVEAIADGYLKQESQLPI